MFDVLWYVIALLVVVLLLFFLADWYLKRGDKKKTAKPNTKPAPTATPNKADKPSTEAKPVTKTTLPTMTIYNSNLADDLDVMLRDKQTQPGRPNLSNRVATKGHIANYVAEKNYHTFDFAEPALTDEPEPMTFTKEDYKKIVALSNIDDKK